MIVEKGDCRNITISRMLENLNVNLSPVMCFGLGECYDFRYWIDKKATFPMIIIMGRNFNGEVRLLNNFNIKVKTIGDITKSVKENMLEVNKLLNEDKNVFLNVDRYYLDYLDRQDNKYHCGWHSVLIEKLINEDNQLRYTVFEPLLNEHKLLSYQSLAKGRSSECSPFSPEFYGFYIEENHEVNIGFDLVKMLIERNFRSFLKENDSGIYYLKKFKDNISCFHNESLVKSNVMYVKLQLNFMSKYILEYENTQSFYRKVYAEFLKEVDRNFKLNSIGIEARNFELLGEQWNKLGNLMLNYDKDISNNYIDKLEASINSIIENEKTSAEELLLKLSCY